MEKSKSAIARATAQATTWGLAKVGGADKVHSEQKLTGDGVRVAVLDTGHRHPDLAGKLAGDDPGGWIESTPTANRYRGPYRMTAATTAPTSRAPSPAATPPARRSVSHPTPT